jgi:hypothetical protein
VTKRPCRACDLSFPGGASLFGANEMTTWPPRTDRLGHLLKTDQRGLPRPNTEDRSGCDMGAFERQSD